MFCWRFCTNILPSKQLLKRRHLIEIDTCSLCGREAESNLHSLWKCKVAQKTWKDVFKDQWKELLNVLVRSSDNAQAAIVILEWDAPVELELIWTTAWTLWNQRNAKVMQGIEPNPGSIAAKARIWLEEWQQANVKEQMHPEKNHVKWEAPATDVVKINFDGAISTHNIAGGMGAVIRNCRGEFMAAMSEKVPGIRDSEVIEAYAALHAMDLALSVGFDRVVLEGDALCVINAIASNEEDLSPIGNIILEIQTKARLFRSFEVNHVYRDANAAAHRVAKYALSLNEGLVWMEEFPPFLSDVLVKDNLSN